METGSLRPQLIVSAAFLMPTWRQQDCIADGAVAIAGDTVAAVGPRAELVGRYPEARELHEPHGLIMPGLINSHTHASMSCFRGLADDLPLMTWLQEHIFPVEARLDGDMVYCGTLLSMAEMIKSGTTSFCDMYLFAKEVARAADRSGMRAWIGEVLYDFPSPNYGALDHGFAYVGELLDQYRQHPLISVTVDPHAVYTCAPSLLERCGRLAADAGSLFVIHLSETQSEVAACRERYGLTPVQHLASLNLLNERVLAAHCVWLETRDLELLTEHGVKVSHCQESNMKLASGTAPIPELLARGVTVSLGTDGSASNNDVDLFSEMSSVAKAHKAAAMDPTVMSAETTLQAATAGGAAALGQSGRIGRLAAGCQADLIVLDLYQPHLTPLYNIPSHLVYAARGADVIHSIIAGRLVMQNRRLLTIDEDELLDRMGVIGKRVLQVRNDTLNQGK